MRDEQKSKAQLIQEIRELRRKTKTRKTSASVEQSNDVLNLENLTASPHHPRHDLVSPQVEMPTFEKIIQNHEILVALIKASNHVLYRMSPDWTEMRQVKGRDFLADSTRSNSNWLHDYIPSKDHELVLSVIDKGIKSCAPFKFESRIIRADGSLGWTFSRAVPVLDKNGEIIEWIGMANDITKQKKAEDALRNSEEKYRLLVENQQDLIVKVDLEGHFLFISSSYCKTFGKTENELLGNTFMPLVHEDDRESTKEAMKTLFNPPHTAYMEQRAMTASGWRWFAWQDTAILDDKGHVKEIIGVGRDITDRKQTEEALQESQYMLEEVSRVARIGGWEHDLVTRKAKWTKETYRIVELPEDAEPPGPDEHLEYYPPESRRLLAESIENSIRERVPFDVDLECSTATGKLFWARALGYPLYEGDRCVKLFGIFQDISESKQAEQALHDSEERFHLAMNATQDGLFDWNLVTNEIYYSPGWKKMLGYEDDEIPNDFSVWEKTTKPEDAIRAWEMQKEVINRQRDRFEMEFKMKHKEGHWVDILSRATAVFDEDGNAVRMIGTHVDITKRKHAENALSKSESTLQKIFEILPIGLWFADETGKLLRGNPAGKKIWGAEPKVGIEEYGVFKARQFPSGKELEPNDWALAKTILEGVTIVDEMLEIDAFDGNKKIILNYTAPLKRDDGSVQGAIIVNNEITELIRIQESLHKAMMKAETATRAKSEFLANMSHEIRTPLNGLMGMLQFMNTTPLNNEQKEFIAHALQSSRRLLQLLSDILDLSRVEAGKMTITMEPFDFKDTLDGIFQLFLPSSKEKKLDLRIHINPDIPSTLVGDAPRLQQVLSNLVGNAIKFTNMGHITIETHPLPHRKPDEYHVLFSVADTGIGIADNVLERLFNSFTQAESSYKRRFQGAGLGLAICKRLLELMGGNMTVESKEGFGTTVYFCIPFKSAEPSTSLPPS